MALAFDVVTRFPATETTGFDTTTGDRTFTHNPVGVPKGAVVVIGSTATAQPVTGVLYAGVAMALSTSATDTTEAGSIWVYTLTAVDVPTDDPATITLQGCTADSKFCSCFTVTAATTQTTVAGSNAVNTTVSTNPTVTVTTSGANVMLFGGVHGGAAAPTSYVVGSGYTVGNDGDHGAKSARTERSTSPVAAGSNTFNFTFGTSDDWCIAASALQEFTPPPPPPLTMIVPAFDPDWGRTI